MAKIDFRPAIPAILVYLILLAVVWLGYFTPREEFLKVVLIYGMGFSAYFYLIWKQNYKSLNMFILIGLLLRISLFAAEPAMSDDHHRFVWDGVLVSNGLNPYSELPAEIDLSTAPNGLSPELLEDLNSPDFHSVYPPFLQYIFGFSAWIAGGDVHTAVLIMRIFILIAELISIVLIFRLLNAWGLPLERTAIYAFNPLVVIELTGNLHSEAYMICFTLLAVWLLSKNRASLSAIAMGFAICSKIWPLIFLPFLVKRIGWKRTIMYGSVALVTCGALLAPFWYNGVLADINSSVDLYFKYFEYNASVYGVLRYFFGSTVLGDWSVVQILTALALAALFIEDLLSKKEGSTQTWPNMMFWSLSLYLLFASTVHPWYVLPVLAFSLFTNFRWPIYWTILLPLTYITYWHEPWQQDFWLITIEYAVVFGLLGFELKRQGYLSFLGEKKKASLGRS